MPEALDLARAECRERPLDADAWYMQAAVHAMMLAWADVAECCRRVVALRPAHVEAHHNLAVALSYLGQSAEAVAAFQQTLLLDPDDAEAHYGLGLALQATGRSAEAARHFQAALNLDGRLTDAHGRLGSAFADLGRWEEAIASYRRLLAAVPGHLSGLINYGAALKAVGRLDEAADSFRQAAALHPESAVARYFVAALGAGPVPAQPPADYVRELFDGYAGRFDEHLGRQLQYRLPEVMAGTLRELFANELPWRNVLDLGCGTGLVGVAVRGLTGRLTGVDLSPRMVEQARRKAVYDELHVADIVAFIGPRAQAFDVILAADVFIYIGDLAPVIRGAVAALGPRGVLAFSVEQAEADTSYRLQPSGRYAHSQAYVSALAASAGLEQLRVSALDLRVEAGKAIPGLLFVYRLPAQALR